MTRIEMPPAEDIIWAPQPGPQTWLLQCEIEDVLFGGAAGGGKSDGLLGVFAAQATQYPAHARGIFFRRTYPELEEAIARSKEIYEPLGWKWREKDRSWTTPHGSSLKMRPFDSDADWQKYWGHQYTCMLIDEAGNWPDPGPLDKLRARLRSAHGVPCLLRLSANPGGPGHGWVKRRYIDPAAPMTPHRAVLGTDPLTQNPVTVERVFIPSKVTDNLILMRNDPSYVHRLYSVGDPALVDAWLNGNWDVALGQYFTEWLPHHPDGRTCHVIKDRVLPAHWYRLRALDWGSKTPFCVLWGAVSDGSIPGIPRGAIVIYREFYGADADGKGLEMDAAEVARCIAQRERQEQISDSVADYQIFRGDFGPSIAEQMLNGAQISWRSANKDRVSGWLELRHRLRGDGYGTDEWSPQLYIMECCPHLIRTLPQMQHDDKNPEDVLKKKGIEDHAPETLRYMCMARPVVKRAPGATPASRMTLNQLMRNQKVRQYDRLTGC